MKYIPQYMHTIVLSRLCFVVVTLSVLNTLRRRQNSRYYADDIFNCIILKENVLISLNISLKFVPKVRINNIPALIQIMAWRRPGGKPLSEPRAACLPDAFMRHSVSMSFNQWIRVNYLPICFACTGSIARAIAPAFVAQPWTWRQIWVNQG